MIRETDLRSATDGGALKGADLEVYIQLLVRRDFSTHVAEVSVQDIADAAQLDRRSVRRSLKRLVDAGKISVERPGRWRGSKARYLVRLPGEAPPCAKERGACTPPFEEERGAQRGACESAHLFRAE